MKLSKKSHFIAILGIVASIFAGMWVMRSQQAQERERLNEELSIAVTRLNNVKKGDEFLARQGELEMQISQTLSQLDTAKATLSQSTEGISISSTLFGIAEVAGVEVTQISSSELASSNWEEITLSVLPLTVTVEGDVPNILSFIGSLDDSLNNPVIKSVIITIPETTSEEKPSANIQLGIYSYQGA